MKRTAKRKNNHNVRSDPYGFIKKFDNSGYSSVRIGDFPQKNAMVCVASLRATLKKHRIYHIEIVRRGDTIYLIRKNCKVMNYAY